VIAREVRLSLDVASTVRTRFGRARGGLGSSRPKRLPQRRLSVDSKTELVKGGGDGIRSLWANRKRAMRKVGCEHTAW